MKLRRTYRLAALALVALLSLSAITVDRLKSHVTWLADPAREGRHSGLEGAVASAAYIAEKFRESGLEVQLQDFGGNRTNVVARTGSAEKYVLIGSHYDGQGIGHPSASDNAAGIAILLELARELKAERLPASFVFVAFDDEEQGLNGSRYYADHPLYPLENAITAIIFDTMGRSFIDLPSWTLFVLGTEYSKELAAVVGKHSRPEMLVAGTDLIGPRSDFAAFAVKRVPYLFFSHATHKDYHGPGDTPDRVNYTRLAQDSSLIAQIVRDIARLQNQPMYLKEPIYPKGEAAALIKQLSLVEKERSDLPQAYKLMFQDLKMRLQTDGSRETLGLATAALLAIATPRLSTFMLNFMLGPFYEREEKREIAAAIYEESLKWTTSTSARRELEEKIKALRN